MIPRHYPGEAMAEKRYHTGDLDTRLQILRSVTATSGYNEPVTSFVLYKTIWCKRIDASSGESLRAAEVGAQITAHFVVRHTPETATVTPLDRLQIDNGLLYDITGVRELDRGQWLEFHAVARADR